MDSKFYFNLKKTGIYKAVSHSRNPIFLIARALQKVLFVFFTVAFLFFIYGFFTTSFSPASNSLLLGISLLSLSFSAAAWLKSSFFELKLKNPKLPFALEEFLKNPKDRNLAELLSFGSAGAVFRSLQFQKSQKEARANSTILFHYLLSINPELTDFVFIRLLLNPKEIKKALKQNFPGTPESAGLEEIILESAEIAKGRGHSRIEVGDVFTSLAKKDPIFQHLLVENNLRVEDIENLTWWYESLTRKREREKRWWEYDNLIKKGTLAKEWTAGYTVTLDKYSIDWTESAKRQKFPEIIGHESEIEQTERILARHEYNNVLLVGEPGVGRKGIIQGIVRKSVFGQSLPDVNYKRVVELDMQALLAEFSNPEDVEATLDAIFQEVVSAGNVILVIDEFHNFIAVKPGPGMIDISGVISSYLHLPQFQIVAITSYAGLHKNIEQNPSVLNLLEKVEVTELSEKETMLVLENLSLRLENKYNLFVSYPALREIVSLCKRYLTGNPFPKKALDLLDEVMIYVKKSVRDGTVLPSHVASVVSQRTQVPVGEVEAKEKKKLLNLEELIHQRIINQEEAVREVSTALRRARAEMQIKSAPMGTFLFLGPTGVGKTETSKALAQIYFGSEQKMIRLDMSEFQDVKDISRLIGSVGEEGLLTTAVREDPFSLILLDELEKAHPNILNLFLQVLDEGFLTDGVGRKVNFKNTIIIATSNAGYQMILKALKEKSDWQELKQKMLDYLFEAGTFRPEFINRFDAVVIFKPLSKKNLLDISELIMVKLKKGLKQKGIEFIVTEPLKEKIVELGYDPTFGARQMKRVVQDKVENVLASALLSGELKRGDKVEINPESFSLMINQP